VDVVRLKKPKRGRWIALAIVVAAVVVVSVALGRLRQALPVVDAATVTTATVVRGPMLREVRATGTLVPVDVRFITAETSGRVESIHFRGGAVVTPDTILVDLSNPEAVLQQLQTEREVASAEADLLQLSYRLQADKLTQENALWTLRQESADVERRAAAYQRGGIAVFTQLDIDQMKDRAAGLRQRIAVAEKELAVLEEGLSTQIAAQRAQIQRRRDMAVFRKKQVEAMQVRAGGDGVLQEMPLEIGQWVSPGTTLAKIVKPEHLKALLRVPEGMAKDVAVGQTVNVDTRNGIVPGHVFRVATAAVAGTVQIEVLLDGELPAGARPDLTVDGIVQIERLDDVLSVERPVGAQQDKPMALFRVEPGGREAVKVEVELGHISVKAVEIKGGLREGTQVVVSDMSRWESVDRIALR
jgi:multidrug efflux pump subunit AcrA (membrane-fusion protein)